MTTLKKEAIFYPDLAGSKSYRIPSLLTTSKGTVIAGIDARIVDQTDNPNQIDASIRRSFDNGETWEAVQKLVAFAGEGLDGAAAIDTALLEDEETETIFMLYCHTPGGIGLLASESGVGFTADGNRLLYDQAGKEFHLHKNGDVTDSAGNNTNFHVDSDGYVFFKQEQQEQQGNIYYKQGVDPKESLLEARTSFLQVVKSEDDGATWSAPIELNNMVKEEWMRFIGAGPGRGIQIKNGKYKGRIAFPIYFSNEGGHLSCTLIYSDDHGVTWERGDSPNDGRELDGKILKAKTIDEGRQYLTESQVIEMPTGELCYYMRNHHERKRTAVATSQDGGATWDDVVFDDALVDPICQSSVVRYPDTGDGKTRILFSNPNHETIRKTGTIRLSEDGGKTWPYSKVVETGNYGYSCLTVMANGEIGLSYEKVYDYDDWNNMDIQFARFSLEWLKG